MKVGITGQSGFIGKHLKNYLSLQKDISIIPFEKTIFDEPNKLIEFVKSCDTIVHLAAMNRHDDQEVLYKVNVDLVEKLIVACEKAERTPNILFSSSTQERKANHYGRSKKEGFRLLTQWAKKWKARVVCMVIPNVFGPFSKPYYNSVVATFSYQLTHGESPKIIHDGNLKMIYVNELIEDIAQIIKSDVEGSLEIFPRYEVSVSEILSKLENYRNTYMENGKFPSLESSLDLALFNTFRCYIDHKHYPVSLSKYTDNRGSFVEIVRANTSGQFSFSTTKTNITRGNHFHTRKAERFAVISGKARIALRRIDSEDVIEYFLDGANPAYVDMPIWYTHNITNIGEEELTTLFWINEPYNPEDTDTYYENV